MKTRKAKNQKDLVEKVYESSKNGHEEREQQIYLAEFCRASRENSVNVAAIFVKSYVSFVLCFVMQIIRNKERKRTVCIPVPNDL